MRTQPARIRLRVLDDENRLAGLSDLEVPVEEMARNPPRAARVFVTENETNFLAFPSVPGGLVIFGAGYAIDRLAELPWLGGLPLHYWGDIDTHGFGILDRLRAHLPSVQSLLMDRATLLAHRPLWVEETDRLDVDLRRLTVEEHALYDDLRYDRIASRVRLEQERIAYRSVVAAVVAAVERAARDGN